MQKTEAAAPTLELLDLPGQDVEVWQNMTRILARCTKTVQVLRKVLDAVIGSGGVTVTGRRDAVKKQLRMQAKDGDIEKIRVTLSVHRESLSVSLTLLTLFVFAPESLHKETF